MISYRKIGGIHFLKLGRFGFQWYVSRRAAHKVAKCVEPARDEWRGAALVLQNAR